MASEYSSDSETESDSPTVLLGVYDGEIESTRDLVDPAVSRIGGRPAFLPAALPPIEVCSCKSCGNKMELLLQIWCPFEDSPMDRVLYVWGCSRRLCQHQTGSIRAHRCVRYNARFAKKLVQLRDNPQTTHGVSTGPGLSGSGMNPFSVSMTAPGAFGASLFDTTLPSGGIAMPPGEVHDEPPVSKDEIDRLAVSLEASRLHATKNADWSSVPAYKPVYLSTISEPSIPSVPPKASVVETSDLSSVSGDWKGEEYESSTDDNVFEAFKKRAAYEGKQCLRYELAGTPLPYQADQVYDALFRRAVNGSSRRVYNLSSIPQCPSCHKSRVFECQLMPALIHSLRPAAEVASQAETDDQRLERLARILHGEKTPGSASVNEESLGFEWGTCMIFSCSEDCGSTEPDGGPDGSWKEEFILVQWE